MVAFSEQMHKSCFPFLDESEASLLLDAMEIVHCRAGTQLFRHSEPGNCMYFVVTGRIAVQNKTGFGERMQVVALLDSGAPVGEGGLLSNSCRGSTVVAVKDADLLCLSRSAFEKVVHENSFLGITFLQWLLGKVTLRLQKSSERLAHVL